MKNTAHDASGMGPKWVSEAGRLSLLATSSKVSKARMMARWVLLFMCGFQELRPPF
jgi:hypothetical protein